MTDQPTARDLENERRRRAIAERQNATYRRAELLALNALGPGWTPSMKLSLFRVEDCRPTGKDDPAPEPAAVAFEVSRWLMGERMDRFIRELPDGQVLVSERYEDVFQGMLDEEHPTRTLEIRGVQVPTKRYQLYWSALELYEPRSAEQLAALRVSRERGKKEREEKKFQQDNPLLAWMERVQRES